MTITSNRILLAYAEPLEDVTQYVLARAAADDLVEACAGRLQIGEQKFLRDVRRRGGVARGDERNTTLLEQRDMSRVRDRRSVAQSLVSNESVRDCLMQSVEAVAGERTYVNASAESFDAILRE
jgi:hypothetical protein